MHEKEIRKLRCWGCVSSKGGAENKTKKDGLRTRLDLRDRISAVDLINGLDLICQIKGRGSAFSLEFRHLLRRGEATGGGSGAVAGEPQRLRRRAEDESQEKKRSGVKIVVCVLTVEYFFHVGPPSFLGCLRVDFTELEMSKNLLLGEEILQPVLSCVFGYYRTKF
ncbi:hypothetical protein MTR_3g023090 [Medicago truncatula]|uniref:Uncharacterized protein n=1 Tax=Medicago truncatula TaxID=3880 RepID=G7J1N1_MEDTR|nr:hypothetical protein MTR_3g023090 [Medicago truncatula]